MPLKIDLKPGEKFILNGAVLQVGKNGRSLVLMNDAVMLRGKDVMQEDEADTPAKRVYFVVMLMYIDPPEIEDYRRKLALFMTELRRTLPLPDVEQALSRVEHDVEAGHYYRAMKTLKAIIAVEAAQPGVGDRASAGQ